MPARLHTIADTLEARADATDPLAPAELTALAATLRSIAREFRIADELLNEHVEQSRQIATDGRTLRGLTVIDGGRPAVMLAEGVL